MKQKSLFCQKLLMPFLSVFRQLLASYSEVEQVLKLKYETRKRRLNLKIKRKIGGNKNGNNELTQSKV